MRPLLAIETSGKSLGVALRAESGLLFSENVTAGSVHGRALAPLIRKALDAGGLKATDLEAVAVSLGPGSWTGLRIGISAAKALAWGAKIGIVGVPSFEALARDAVLRVPGNAVLTVRDARGAGFFCSIFSDTFDPPQRWLADGVLSKVELLFSVNRVLGEHPGVALSVCGDAVCLSALETEAQQRGWNILTGSENISVASLAECGWKRCLSGECERSAAGIHKLAPLYLRASSPELKLKS
jgi:tRNA threonylcarbamoyl adenosine modification protein YeaZ